MTGIAAQAFSPEERRLYIGVSELGAILGVDKWRTPLDVFNEKSGRTEPFAGNHHTERGVRLEHIAVELFTEITGRKLRRMTRDLIHPEYDFIRGHIDRLVEGENTVAEIKVVSLASFRKLQREGLPESWVVQLNGYIGLGKYAKGVFIVFCPDQFDVISFEIEFDEAIYNAAIGAAAAFWNDNIVTGRAPLDDDSSSTIEIAKHGGNVTFRDDETFTTKAQALREATALKRDAEEIVELAKKDLLDVIEDLPGIYEGGGLRVYYTEQAGRKTLDKKAVAAAGIDLSPFEKQGNPFRTFKTYQIGE